MDLCSKLVTLRNYIVVKICSFLQQKVLKYFKAARKLQLNVTCIKRLLPDDQSVLADASIMYLDIVEIQPQKGIIYSIPALRVDACRHCMSLISELCFQLPVFFPCQLLSFTNLKIYFIFLIVESCGIVFPGYILSFESCKKVTFN